MKTAALLWGRSVHTKFVQVMVEDHYKYCYPNRRQAIDAYRKFFLTLDCDITRKNGITASCPIDGSLLMPHAAELAKLMLEFAKPLISV